MMVGGTPQQQQQQGTTAAPSAEEEALKRNTDCVYFLTSPLACKKGGECEYRHSEYARVNPRDCYFWLNGNCLNPKCGFRHPPLDGLFGTETDASAGSFLPPLRMPAVPAVHAPQNPGKQAVQCIYFQRGFCSRGDKCGFLHGPSPTSSKSSQQIVAPAPSTELPPTKPHPSHQKFSQEPKVQQANFSKAMVEPKQETGLRRNGVERSLPPSKNLHDEVPKYKATNLHPVVNGNSTRFNRMHQTQVPDDHGFLNGKDADEFLRESSPGFDVLVDDELRNSDFYHGEDQYGRTRGQEGRNSNPVNEYDIGHSVDYSSVGDRETYHDLRGYDNYEHIQGQYAWEKRRSSSERMPLGQDQLQNRGYPKIDSPELSDDIDLRYRLSKHKRDNGLRSVVSHDFGPDRNVEERAHQGSLRESSISGRLRGRIKLSRKSPSGSDLRVERERDKIRSRGRLSPVRPQVPSHQGRLRDRIKARVEEDYDSEGRNPRGARMRREMMDDNRTVNFAGPKSLAELKGSTSSEGRMQQSLRKRKQLEDNQPSEGDLSFKGPMPLSEILKRKRVSEAGASGTGKQDNNQKEVMEILLGSSSNKTVEEPESGVSCNKKVVKEEEESKSAAVENEVGPGQDSSVANQGEPETESGMMVDDSMEDHEYEGDDHREGEYEYEQVDEGEYYEEGENADADAEEEDVDDDDDFAKKIGVVFS